MRNPNSSRVILHVDADAFFASCEQAMHPQWKGKPVVCGGEKGIATAFSYEAKKFGVKRGMRMAEVKQLCPHAIITNSDFEVYNLFSRRMFDIIKNYCGEVEEYSIDEVFTDITGIPQTLGMDYEKLLQCIQEDIELSLGISVSLGCAPSKTLAKIASSYKKPHNRKVMITTKEIMATTQNTSVENVWGIGVAQRKLLQRFGIKTVGDLMARGELFVMRNFNAPLLATYRELKGVSLFEVITTKKTSYLSITKSHTFEKTVQQQEVYRQCLVNLERACYKLRSHNMKARNITIFLKTQNFIIASEGIHIEQASNIPYDFIPALQKLFLKLYKEGKEYRATGITMEEIQGSKGTQLSLSINNVKEDKKQNMFMAVDGLVKMWGKGIVTTLATLTKPREGLSKEERKQENRKNYEKGIQPTNLLFSSVK